ncbi:hypothetical protein WMF27_07680 [Sorangium sp. So ce281]|uniref:hypothetical protein n=1 Tax=unclassified Sorangium TaxID=2621164 RepID=UPI003F636400
MSTAPGQRGDATRRRLCCPLRAARGAPEETPPARPAGGVQQERGGSVGSPGDAVGTRVGAAQLDLLKEQDWRGGPTWEGRESILLRTQDDPIITDDNMATEWWAFGTYP